MAGGLGVPPSSPWAVRRAIEGQERAAREAVAGRLLREWLRSCRADVEALESEAASLAAEPGQFAGRESWFRALAEIRGHPQRDGLLKAIREWAVAGHNPHEIACHLKAMLAATVKAAREKHQYDISVYPETIERMREAGDEEPGVSGVPGSRRRTCQVPAWHGAWRGKGFTSGKGMHRSSSLRPARMAWRRWPVQGVACRGEAGAFGGRTAYLPVRVRDAHARHGSAGPVAAVHGEAWQRKARVSQGGRHTPRFGSGAPAQGQVRHGPVRQCVARHGQAAPG